MILDDTIQYSLATAEDFPQILDLQHENLFQNLDPENRASGFLTVEFTNQLLTEVVEDIGIAKASTEEELVGYFMAQTLEFNSRFPLLSKIISRFPKICYQDRSLSDLKTFIAGPMCVAKEWRKHGITKNMFHHLLNLTHKRFQVGVTFVSTANSRSLHVSENILGMTPVDELAFEGKDFRVFAFSTR